MMSEREDTDWETFEKLMNKARKVAMTDGWTRAVIEQFREDLGKTLSEEHGMAMEDFEMMVSFYPPVDKEQ